MNCEIVRQTHS